jgi:tRNA (guanine37-N1)-methyltransferase
MVEIEILTLFPEMVDAPLRASVLGKALARGAIRIRAVDIRDFATGKHQVTDDVPFGGGAGMVMKVEPIVAAVEDCRARLPGINVMLTSPRGRRFDQEMARDFHSRGRLALVCGRYEGVDERATQFVDGEVSIGDFVMTGGEFAALCIADAVARLERGVLGNEDSCQAESFERGLLEYPQYTRPREFRGRGVPEILLTGNHDRVKRFRRREALVATRLRRPDLFAKLTLTEEDEALLSGEEP